MSYAYVALFSDKSTIIFPEADIKEETMVSNDKKESTQDTPTVFLW